MSDKAIPEFAPFGYTLARRMAALLAGMAKLAQCVASGDVLAGA